MALQNLQKAVDMDAALKGMQGMVKGLQETVGKLEGKMDGLKGVVMVLEEEVNKLKEVEAIRELQHKFAGYVEEGVPHEVLSLFTQERNDCEIDIDGQIHAGWEKIEQILDICKQTPGRDYPFSEGVVELEFDHVDGEVVARIQGLGGEESELVKEEGGWKIWKARWNSGRGWR